MELAVKFVQGFEDRIQGLGIPFGGPNNGKDLEGEFFTAKTDLSLDWFKERPLLYHHGLDGSLQATPVGTIKAYETTDLGVWVQGQLDQSSKYFSAIKKLVDQGRLFFSSGAMHHLVKISPNGEIKRWPWVEMSLTPVPANPYATITPDTAEKHFKSVGLDFSAKAFGKPDPKDKEKDPSKDNSPSPKDKSGDSSPSPKDKSGDSSPSPKDKAPDNASKPDKAKGDMHDQMDNEDPNMDMSDGMEEDSEEGSDTSSQIDLSASYESVLQKLTSAVNPVNVVSGQVPTANVIIGTFPGFCIVQEGDVNSGSEGALWKVDYTIDERDNVQLGDAEAIAPEQLSQGPSSQAAPIATEAETAAKFARTLLSSTKGLYERRIRQGRELSAMNRERISEAANSLDIAAKTLKSYLTSVNPTAKAGLADRERLEAELDLLKLKEY